MHFFVVKLLSIDVMTYNYVYTKYITYYLVYTSPKPTSDGPATQTAKKLQHATAGSANDARPPLSFDVSFLENLCEYPHILYIARN